MQLFHKEGRIAEKGWIWVFGSNTKGIHSCGDARIAKNNFGAAYGVSIGRHKSSYAVPVQDVGHRPLSVADINAGIQLFFQHALSRPKERFFVTKLTHGIDVYPDSVIAPLFNNAPGNCSLPLDWKPFLASAEEEL